MSVTDLTSPEPRRFANSLPRPLWIGLAAIVLIVAGVTLRIWAPIYRQHLAIREFERAGGYVATVKSWPDWLQRLSGTGPSQTDSRLKVFDEPMGAYAGKCRSITDSDLVSLRALPTLRARNLSRTQVTDDGIDHLVVLKNLEILVLDFTHVTDTGLVRLKGLKNLKKPSVKAIVASDKGLYELKRALPEVQIEM